MVDRSIPACAGEPIAGKGGSNGGSVYPRVCGGTWSAIRSAVPPEGLSPRVRGNRVTSWCGCRWGRSIPACAGEPRHLLVWLSMGTVYPRVCGGTLPMLSHRRAGYGPIPACAGEPVAWSLPARYRRVYPRVCGGTEWTEMEAGLKEGLSPRVRGNRIFIILPPVQCRSIPACAGEPHDRHVQPLRGWVYPRVCGGTTTPASRARIGRGLSPRVRGNR